MSPFDAANAFFELGAALMVWLNVRRLRQDRIVRGMDWRTIFFFALWGWWNLLYYPHLGQWLSAAAGAVLVVGNTSWVVLYLRIRREVAAR